MTSYLVLILSFAAGWYLLDRIRQRRTDWPILLFCLFIMTYSYWIGWASR